MKASTSDQIRSFALVGAFGFIVDAGVLWVLHNTFSMAIVPARFVSFFTAVTLTWWLNRNRTFRDHKSTRKTREWSRYTIVNGTGGAINIGVFFWLIERHKFFAELPLLPLAIASAIAMVFNFTLSKHIAFRAARTQ